MIGLKELNRRKVKFAFDSIRDVRNRNQDKDSNNNFKSNIKNIPMCIYTNGLIATIAFIMKKDEKSYKEIGKILLAYIENSNFNDYDFNGKALEDLIRYLLDSNSKEYRRITLDILSILEWLVRFADGMIEEKKEGDSIE